MTKAEYFDLHDLYNRMSTKQLKQAIRQLYSRKFEQHDITAYEEHRVAARVLIERERDGQGLMFHMKKFVLKSC